MFGLQTYDSVPISETKVCALKRSNGFGDERGSTEHIGIVDDIKWVETVHHTVVVIVSDASAAGDALGNGWKAAGNWRSRRARRVGCT